MASEPKDPRTGPDGMKAARKRAAALLESFDSGDAAIIELEADKLLSGGPVPADLLNLFAMLTEKFGADSVTEKFYTRLIKLNPTVKNQHRKLGLLQLKLGKRGAALRTLNAAIAVDKNDTVARTGLGDLLDELGRQDEARKHYLKVTEQRPDDAAAWIKLARSSCATDRFEEGIEQFSRAISIDDQLEVAHVEKSEALLKIGRFEEGWQEYVWRPDGYALTPDEKRVFETKSLSGKRILLRQETGLPETLLGLRYAPLLRESSSKITLSVDRSLMPLLMESDLADDMVASGGPDPEYDIEMKLLTAARFLRAGKTTQPLAGGYLTAAPKQPKVTESGLRVGIALRAPGSRDAAIPVARLREILTLQAPVTFISLENTGAEDFRSINWAEGRVQPAPGDMDDPRQLADALSDLDLVIAPGGTIAHLAGAMGIRCWLILQLNSDWMWGAEGDRTVWYNSIRIFRQTIAGRWSKPLESLRKSLQTLATVIDDPAMSASRSAKTSPKSGVKE